MLRPSAAASWLALALTLSCERANASHCGNNLDRDTCRLRDPTRPFCSLCEAANDGCRDTVDARPGCAVETVAGGESSSSSTGTQTEGSSSGSGSVSSETTGASTSTSSSSGPASSSSDETTSDAESSTTAPPAMCGNDVVEEGEVCDGSDLAGASCVTLGSKGGELGCRDNCLQFDPSRCDGFGDTCGNGMIEPPEQCDGQEFGNATCLSLTGRGGGALQCMDCLINTTNCCRLANESCAVDGECCSNSCTGLLGLLIFQCD